MTRLILLLLLLAPGCALKAAPARPTSTPRCYFLATGNPCPEHPGRLMLSVCACRLDI